MEKSLEKLTASEASDEWPYVWYWRRRHPERRGQHCKLVGPPTQLADCLIEFPDGCKIRAPRAAVRRRPDVPRETL